MLVVSIFVILLLCFFDRSFIIVFLLFKTPSTRQFFLLFYLCLCPKLTICFQMGFNRLTCDRIQSNPSASFKAVLKIEWLVRGGLILKQWTAKRYRWMKKTWRDAWVKLAVQLLNFDLFEQIQVAEHNLDALGVKVKDIARRKCFHFIIFN